MPEISLMQISDLLERANNRGMKISYEDSELTLKFSKRKEMDLALLEELKLNRDQLIDYFKNYRRKKLNMPGRIKAIPGVDYEITPRQHYWVDEERDWEFKRRTYGLVNYTISGIFDVRVFSRAVLYLFMRHESLRSTFHKKGDGFVMKVEEEDSPLFALDHRDLRSLPPDSKTPVEDLFYFHDHDFDLQRGPLFLMRLLQVGDDQYLLSAKLHHSIYDAWSVDILLRDLIAAYLAYSKEEEPRLPVVEFQYKEYMSFANEFTKSNRAEHEAYWLSMYKSVPDELMIPGAKRSNEKNPSDKVCAIKTFSLSKETVNKLKILSGRHTTSLFVVLQATCKSWLCRITGQNDLVIGIQGFGRDDMEGVEDQIGFYSEMNLIRTVLESRDELDEVIRKVKRSNEDAQKYKAYTLMQTLSEMLPPPYIVYGTFWKISLNYTDGNGYFLDKSNPLNESLAALPAINRVQDPRKEVYINCELDFHFISEKEEMKLQIIYDTNLYDAPGLQDLINGYLNHINENLV